MSDTSGRDDDRAGGRRRYRVGFLQTVMVGNMHRYRMLREFVALDPTVEARWFPLRSWVVDDWLRFTPAWIRVRVRHLLDSARLFAAWRLDAVVVHAPEMYGPYGTFHGLVRHPGVLIENSDAPTRPNGRLGARLLARAQRETEWFVPWSTYVRDEIVASDDVSADRVSVVHPGLPLERWPVRAATDDSGDRPLRLLFVGGDAVRKGLDTLIDAFERSLVGECRLDVATQQAGCPEPLLARMAALPDVSVHLDLQPASPEVQQLFAEADVLVLPTRYDLSPWVVLEAMATGIVVIASDVGGIPDMVRPDETGLLIAPEDPDAIVAAVEQVRTMPAARRQAMVRSARRHVEERFDAATNTRQLLDTVKAAIDRRDR